MLRFSKTVFEILIAVLVFAGSVSSAAGAGGEIGRYSDEARDLRLEIKKKKKDAKNYKKKESSILIRLNKIGKSLNDAKKKAAKTRKELAALETKIVETSKEGEDLAEKIMNAEERASGRMVAMYKLNRLGKMNLLASAGSISDFFQSRSALEKILAYDKAELKELEANRARLGETLKKQESERKEKAALEAAYEKQVKEMAGKKRKRSKLLKDIRRKKTMTLAAIDSLKTAARELDRKIESLKKASAKKRLEKKGETVVAPAGGGFSALKGLLAMPAKGRIVSHFGLYKNTEFNAMNFRGGIDIKAEKGEPVRAVHSGSVLFSNWFKGYGNMIIIDHGDSYYTVYAHTDEIFKSKGDHVKSGEVIATVGDTGSMKGAKLHFEVRHHGKPMDPVEWLKKG